MKKVLIAIYLLLVANLSAQEKFTLAEAIDLGLENNYSLRISAKNVEISDMNNSWSTAGRYPSIDLNVTSVNRFDHSVGSDITTNNLIPSAEISWVLFNGFRIFNTKSKLEDQYQLTEGYNILTVENTIKSIVLAYYEVLLQKERLNVFEELQNLSKDRYDRAEASREIGGAVTYEVLQAKTAWLEDQSNYLSQKLNYDNSVRALNLLIGEKSDKKYTSFDEFETDLYDYKFDDLKEKMFNGNRSLQNQYLNEVISERDIDLAWGGMLPSLILSGGYDYTDSRVKINQFDPTKSNKYDYYGNLVLSLNVFDGLNTKKSLEIAKLQNEISKIETEELVHSLTNTLSQLLELYQIQKSLLEVAEENVAAAKLNFQISEEKFKSGAINSFNFRDIQIVYLNASLQRLNSVYNLISTNTELARLTGAIISEK